MIKTLALIHTSPVLVPVFAQLAGERLPGISVFHMVDESLIKNTIAAGRLTKVTSRRVLSMIESAELAGAGAAMVTCSSIGPAVSAARAFVEIPVLRIDEAMAEAAVVQGRRIGVAATLRTTLEPTVELLESTAGRMNRGIEVVPCLCDGAFDAVISGQPERHDALVKESLERVLPQVDVVVLAQASMARVAAALPPGSKPVLASPRLAMEQARRLLVEAA